MLRFFKVPPAVFFLGLASLFSDVASEIIYPLLPIFLTEVVGVGVLFIGALEGFANSVASLTKLFSGYYSDRFRRRTPFVMAGYTIAAIARPLIGIATLPWQILAIRITDRLGKGIREAPRDAWLAALASPQTRGRIFGFHRAMDHVGAMIGPIFATTFLFFFPNEYRPLFLLTLLPGLLSVVSIAKAKHVTAIPPAVAEPTPARLHFRELFTLPRHFRQYLGILAIFALGNASDAFLFLKLKESGVAYAWIPLLWAGHHVIKASSSTWGGHFSDRYGRKTSIILGWLLYAAVYVSLALTANLWIVILLFMTYGLFFGLTEGPEKALVADFVAAEKQGTAFGFYHLILGLGALPASLIFGALWQQWSMSAAFFYGAALSALASLLILFLPIRRQLSF
ncbi:MAG: MFS transporter [Deltaproteobacteria bacterium]|nr:MFS transporter [Deltaproteobacteria bacterium]